MTVLSPPHSPMLQVPGARPPHNVQRAGPVRHAVTWDPPSWWCVGRGTPSSGCHGRRHHWHSQDPRSERRHVGE